MTAPNFMVIGLQIGKLHGGGIRPPALSDSEKSALFRVKNERGERLISLEGWDKRVCAMMLLAYKNLIYWTFLFHYEKSDPTPTPPPPPPHRQSVKVRVVSIAFESALTVQKCFLTLNLFYFGDTC